MNKNVYVHLFFRLDNKMSNKSFSSNPAIVCLSIVMLIESIEIFFCLENLAELTNDRFTQKLKTFVAIVNPIYL